MKKRIKQILKFIGIYKYFVIVYDNLTLFFSFLHCLGKIIFLKKKHQRFLFFPHYSTGGTQQVHIDIVKAIHLLNPVVFITADSSDTHFRDDFYRYSRCFEILPFVKKQFYNKILSYIITKTINSRMNAFTFGSNSYFYYQLLPKLKARKVKRIDLQHAFTSANEPGAEKWSMPLVKYLDCRVVISQHLKDMVLKQYSDHHIQPSDKGKIIVIKNKVDVPEKYQSKNHDTPLNILFLGRNSVEKRLSVILSIAQKMQSVSDVKFYLGGFDYQSIDPELLELKNCLFLGTIENKDEINDLYARSHILLLSSSREGFPLVIMEALSYGVVPVATNVGAIPDYITDGYNGFLFNADEDLDALANKMFEKVQYLYKNREELKSLSVNCYNTAVKEFSNSDFDDMYFNLFK